MINSSWKSRITSREFVLFAAILIVAVVAIPQFRSFNGALSKLTNVDYTLAGLALLLTLGTYFAAAGTYFFLATERIKYIQAVIIQYAAMFVNRIFPAGIGAIGLSFGYLKKMKHSNVQAATIVSVNNLLGFIGNILIVAIVITISGLAVPNNSLPKSDWFLLVVFLPGTLLLSYFLINKNRRKQLIKSLQGVKKQLSFYKDNPFRIIKALFTSSVLSMLNFLSLMLCVYAVGGSVGFAVLVVVYTFGVGVGSSIPTPGGLGGVEAGMVAGFVAFGMPANTALAAVVLYRLISFWLVLLLGAAAFGFVQKKGLVQFRTSN